MGFADDALGFITDPFTGKDVRPYRYDAKAGQQAIQGQATQAQEAAKSQGYALAASQPGGMGSAAALRGAQVQGAQAQQAIGQQSIIAQQQYQQQMEAMRGQAAMQAQMAQAQLDQQRDASIMGMAGAAIGGLALMSDPRVKEDIFEFGSPMAQGYAQGSPRPAPARADVMAPWERERQAAMAPQPGDQVATAPVSQPGSRPLVAATGAGFGKDYGFQYQDIADNQRARREASAMEAAAKASAMQGPVAGGEWTSAGGRQWADQAASQPQPQGGAGAAAGGAAAGLTGKQQAGANMLFGQAQSMIGGGGSAPVDYANAGQYRMFDFGQAPGSDPRVKEDVRFVTSGMATKEGAYQVGSGVDMKEGTAAQQGGALAAAAAALPAYSYRYNEKFAAQEGVPPEQRHIGPMADEMLQNAVYAPSVKQGPDGMLRVDGGRAALENIAVTSDLAREQQRQASELANLKQYMGAESGGETLRKRNESQPARGATEQASARFSDSRLFREGGAPKRQVVYEAGPEGGRARQVFARSQDAGAESALRGRLQQLDTSGREPRIRLDSSEKSRGGVMQPYLDAVRGSAPDEPFRAPDIDPAEMRKYFGTPTARFGTEQAPPSARFEDVPPLTPERKGALEEAVMRESGGSRRAIFDEPPGQMHQPYPQEVQLSTGKSFTGGGDPVEERPSTWVIPWERAGEYDPQAMAESGARRIEDPDEPTKYRYELDFAPSEGRTYIPQQQPQGKEQLEDYGRHPYGSEVIRSGQELSDSYYEVADSEDELENVGDQLDVRAKELASSKPQAPFSSKGAIADFKDRQKIARSVGAEEFVELLPQQRSQRSPTSAERVKTIKSFNNILTGSWAGRDYRFVADELRRRGADVTDEEVRSALEDVAL